MYYDEAMAFPDAEAAMYERAAGAAALEYLKQYSPQHMAQMLNVEAMQLIKEIQTVLDDDSLEDPECFQKIEAIVTAFYRHGVSVNRHDFG